MRIFLLLLLWVTVSPLAAQESTESTDSTAVMEAMETTAPMESTESVTSLDWVRGVRSITAGKLMETVTDLVAFADSSRLRTPYWGRITGSEADHLTAAYLQSRFSSFGYQTVELQRLPFVRKTVDNWSVVLPAASGEEEETSVILSSAFPIVQPDDSLQRTWSLHAELLFVGMGSDLDYIGRSAANKIVLIDSRIIGTPDLHTGGLGAYQRAVSHGAVGVLMALDLPGNMQGFPTMFFPMRKWRQAPAFALGRADGDMIHTLIAQSEGRHPIWVELGFSYAQPITTHTYNILAEARGTTAETVVVIAHTDSWFAGASDNASGLAGLVALAEYVHRIPESARQKRYIFAAVSGKYQDNLGVRALLASKMIDWERVAVVISLDRLAGSNDRLVLGKMTAQGNDPPRVLSVSNQNPRLTEYFHAAILRYHLTPTSYGDLPYRELQHPDIRTMGDRVPVVSLSSASLWHRTVGDTVGTFTGADLERVVRAHAEVLGRIDGTRMEVFRRGAEPARLPPLPDVPWAR